jgi:hypothetical protein
MKAFKYTGWPIFAIIVAGITGQCFGEDQPITIATSIAAFVVLIGSIFQAFALNFE